MPIQEQTAKSVAAAKMDTISGALTALEAAILGLEQFVSSDIANDGEVPEVPGVPMMPTLLGEALSALPDGIIILRDRVENIHQALITALIA